jgi:four helix bundle protein
VISGQWSVKEAHDMGVRHYSDLIVWQKAVDLSVQVYEYTEPFPQREMFGLSNQMRRAAVSVPSNIAEGQGRSTTKDFLAFLAVARGSLQELETQITIAHRLILLDDVCKEMLMKSTSEVARLLNGLVNSLSTDH